MLKRIKYLILSVVLLTGCVKENRENCFSGVKLNFSFTLHEQQERGDLFGESVGSVRAYAFDESGVLARVETSDGAVLNNDYSMSMNLLEGIYTIVVWASDNNDFLNSYKQLQTIDLNANPLTFKELEIGKSRIEELRMQLGCVDAPECEDGLKPEKEGFDDLFFGAVGTRSKDGESRYTIIPVEVKSGEIIEKEVELIRNTNIVRITVEGLEYLKGDNTAGSNASADIYLTGLNSSYCADNVLCAKAPAVYYPAQFSEPIVNSLQADIKTERLEWMPQNGRQSVLNVKFGNDVILYSGDLITLLRNAKDVDGKPVYSNQEDMDRVYVHPLKFVIGADMNVRVFVHNWEIVTLNPGEI